MSSVFLPAGESKNIISALNNLPGACQIFADKEKWYICFCTITHFSLEEDSVLWQKFREGDPIAFESLLRNYYRPLFDYGRRFVSDRDMLKDMVHDLFLHLWERRAFLGKTDHIKPYLLTSLRNRILKNSSRSEMFLAMEHTPEHFHEIANSIESELILTEFAAEKLSRIQHIIQSLTPRQQEIIHLKFYQDLV